MHTPEPPNDPLAALLLEWTSRSQTSPHPWDGGSPTTAMPTSVQPGGWGTSMTEEPAHFSAVPGPATARAQAPVLLLMVLPTPGSFRPLLDQCLQHLLGPRV